LHSAAGCQIDENLPAYGIFVLKLPGRRISIGAAGHRTKSATWHALSRRTTDLRVTTYQLERRRQRLCDVAHCPLRGEWLSEARGYSAREFFTVTSGSLGQVATTVVRSYSLSPETVKDEVIAAVYNSFDMKN
jgi:hypothetical protein